MRSPCLDNASHEDKRFLNVPLEQAVFFFLLKDLNSLADLRPFQLYMCKWGKEP